MVGTCRLNVNPTYIDRKELAGPPGGGGRRVSCPRASEMAADPKLQSTQFNVEGFALVLGASFIGGIRWTLTQMLLQKAELGLQNPIDTMFHLQPLMFLGLFPLFAIFEGLHLSTSEKIFRFQDTGLLLRVLGSLFLGGILAFGLGFSEFLLVSRTSSLTLSIAGIFKEVCTLLLAAHLLGDQISLLNWLGFALCLSGISLHVALKALHSRGEPEPLPRPVLWRHSPCDPALPGR
uniref:Solute carrier family 35 member C2 n=1 Tax=Equus caballus TaxID=9796 RepID=A0A9L0REY4_HORSE